MTIEITLSRIAAALETLAANSNHARALIPDIYAGVAAAVGATYTDLPTPVQAEAEKPKSEKKGGRPSKKDNTPPESPATKDEEATGQDPNTIPLPLAETPAPAPEIVEPTPAPAAVIAPLTAVSYDDMVRAAHAYAAVGTREVITSILSGLGNATKLKDVPESLYGQAVLEFNAALAAVNKSADAIGF